MNSDRGMESSWKIGGNAGHWFSFLWARTYVHLTIFGVFLPKTQRFDLDFHYFSFFFFWYINFFNGISIIQSSENI